MKRIFSLLLVITLVLSMSITVNATEGEIPADSVSELETYEKVSPTTGIHKSDSVAEKEYVEPTIFDNTFLASFGKIVVKDTIEYNGKSYGLFPVYENKEEALSKFYSLYANELKVFAETAANNEELVEFDINNNWREYFGIAMDKAQTAKNGEERDKWYQVVQFMDVYAGYSRNQRVVDFLSDAQSRTTLSDDEYEASLACMMPYTSELYKEYNQKINAAAEQRVTVASPTNAVVSPTNAVAVQARTVAAQTRAWSVASATSYATSYAVNGNWRYRQFAQDCTNFVSQIRHEAGEPQTSTWYYNLFGVNYSNKWTYAEDFMNMIGVTVLTHDFFTFSRNIYAGRFIGLDFTGDGSYDHCGYVTQADDYSADWLITDAAGNSHGTYHYWDFRVAQHTTNYHEWCSGGNDINGWDWTYHSLPSSQFAVGVAGA